MNKLDPHAPTLRCPNSRKTEAREPKSSLHNTQRQSKDGGNSSDDFEP